MYCQKRGGGGGGEHAVSAQCEVRPQNGDGRTCVRQAEPHYAGERLGVAFCVKISFR